jgi:hypothetical protein
VPLSLSVINVSPSPLTTFDRLVCNELRWLVAERREAGDSFESAYFSFPDLRENITRLLIPPLFIVGQRWSRCINEKSHQQGRRCQARETVRHVFQFLLAITHSEISGFLRIGIPHDGTIQGSNTRVGTFVPVTHRVLLHRLARRYDLDPRRRARLFVTSYE